MVKKQTMIEIHGGGGQPVKQAPVAIYRNVILSLTQNLSMLIETTYAA